MVVLDKENFQAEVKDAKGHVLVDFWSESCEQCKELMPDVVTLSEKYGGQMKFAKLDITKARRLAIAEQVLGLPTIILYKDGQKVDEVKKEDASAGSIEAMIKKVL
jgi:thioredoxin 1